MLQIEFISLLNVLKMYTHHVQIVFRSAKLFQYQKICQPY